MTQTWQRCFDNVLAMACSSQSICLLETAAGWGSGWTLNVDHCFVGQGVSSHPNQRSSRACCFLPMHHWSVLLQRPKLDGQRPQAVRQGAHVPRGRSVSLSFSLMLFRLQWDTELKLSSLPGSSIQLLQSALLVCLEQPWLLVRQTIQTLQTNRAASRNLLQHSWGY